MSEPRLVLCGGATSGAASSDASALLLDLQGANPNVFLRIDDISEAMARNVPDVLMDLVELAVYVFAADQATGRGGARDTGDRWRRSFKLHVPVRVPDLWSRESVSEALVNVLSFLSDRDFGQPPEGRIRSIEPTGK